MFQASSSELDGGHAGDPSSNGRGHADRVGAAQPASHIFHKPNLIHLYFVVHVLYIIHPWAGRWCLCLLPYFFSYAAIADQSKPSPLQVTKSRMPAHFLFHFLLPHIWATVQCSVKIDWWTCWRSALQQPELNLPLLTCTRSMPNIRLAKYAKVGRFLNLDQEYLKFMPEHCAEPLTLIC